MGCAGPAVDFRQRATLKVTGWDYLSVQEFDLQTNAFIPAARWSKKGRHHKKKQPSGNEERSGEDYLVGGCFLMSREDPRTDSEGCRGGLCSGSGRRRWRGRRCTWAGDDCPSDSERQIERACVWVTAAFGNDYLLTLRIFNM